MRRVPSDIRARLEHWAFERADSIAFAFLERGEEITESLTYGALYNRACAIAAALQERGLSKRTAILLYPPGLDFVEALFACFLSGTIAVPVPYPVNSRAWRRITGIVRASQADAVLTLHRYCLDQDLQAELRYDGVQRPLIATHLVPTTNVRIRPKGTFDDLALLQFTSGSTASPKGVQVSFGNLAANHEMIAPFFGADPQEPAVTWLPMHHDMGLIGTVLYSLYAGRTVYVMPPFAFLQKPLRWLTAISRFGATCSGAPNFAYDLCVNSIRLEQTKHLDLSRWSTAFCGAEPVNPKTLDAFAKSFADSGFRRSALLPCYGLAEATLFVTGRLTGAGLHVNEAQPGTVSCGLGSEGQTIAIVADGQLQPDGSQGEIWIAGPHVSPGYWREPLETTRCFGHQLPGYPGTGFLRTGDLGLLSGGELFVTGRIKDLVIVRGVKHHINDLERTIAASDPALVPGAGTVLTHGCDGSGSGRVIALQEVRRHAFSDFDHAALARKVSAALIEGHGLRPDRVFFLREGRLPRTTSGKVQRHLCGALVNELEVAATDVIRRH